MARKKNEIQVSQHNVSVLDNFRDAITECGLSKDEEICIREILESAGIASVTAMKIRGAISKARNDIKKYPEYNTIKKLNSKLKQLEKMQEQNIMQVTGVIKTKAAGGKLKGIDNIIGLLEGGK